MTLSIALLTLVFFLLTTALLLLPFYPAWHEWRSPTDDHALHLPDAATDPTTTWPVEMTLNATTSKQSVAQASQRIALAVGAAFVKLVAPTIELGQVRPMSASMKQAQVLQRARTTPLTTLPNAQAWGKKGWRINGPCTLPNAHHLTGSLVVQGPLTIGADCVIEGDIKVHGIVKIGPRSLVTGAVFSTDSITLAESAWVHGPVMSEGHIVLAAHSTVGRLSQPATVCAPHIEAVSGACVHGTLWARESGRLT